jgi:chromosome segregation ATPase
MSNNTQDNNDVNAETLKRLKKMSKADLVKNHAVALQTIETKTSEFNSLTKTALSGKTQNERLASEVDRLAGQVAELQTSNANLMALNKALGSRISDKDQLLTRLTERVDSLESENDDQDTRLRESNRQLRRKDELIGYLVEDVIGLGGEMLEDALLGLIDRAMSRRERNNQELIAEHYVSQMSETDHALAIVQDEEWELKKQADSDKKEDAPAAETSEVKAEAPAQTGPVVENISPKEDEDQTRFM